MRFGFAPLFRRRGWAVLVLVLLLGAVVSAGQIPLRGPPLNMRPPDQVLNIPNPNNPNGPPITVIVQPRVQEMPGKQPAEPLNNGSLLPWFVYNIPPGMLGGNSGSFGGGGFSGSGGFSGFGGSGLGGGFGSFGGSGFGGFGGFGGSFGGGGGFIQNPGGFAGFAGAGFGGGFGIDGGGF